jgi:hypothetical protein
MTGFVIDLAEERFQRDVLRLHRLGEQALYELLIELGRSRLMRTHIEQLVARYAAIDPEMLAATGGKQMPPSIAQAAYFLERAIESLDATARRVGDDDETVLAWLTLVDLDIQDAQAALRDVAQRPGG